jgi:tRNA-2-methylthio-N6-dimethylallyladenosine synthase
MVASFSSPCYYIRTFGCQMNFAEEEAIDTILTANGFQKCTEIEKASIVIFHTCAVRQHAEDKAIHIIKTHSKLLADKNVFLIGCLASKFVLKQENPINLPNLHILPSWEIHKIFSILGLPSNTRYYDGIRFINEHTIFSNPFNLFHRFVPISNGCSNFCSYCIVPYLRGKLISRDKNDIFSLLQKYQENNIIAITILGQNVNQYGEDKKDNYFFHNLLEDTAKRFSFKRIGFITSNPKKFRKEVVKVVKAYPQIERYFHIPIQSGSNKILSLMRRGYTVKEYMEIIDLIREEIEDVVITTDIMVGFPNEDIKDFEETLKIIEKIRFDDAYMFAYSERDFTYAKKYLKDNIPYNEKKERLRTLIELQTEISKKQRERFIGKEKDILFFKKGKEEQQLLGKTIENLVVAIKTKENLIGNIKKAKIVATNGKTLIGELVE